jgi:hypothetical protein
MKPAVLIPIKEEGRRKKEEGRRRKKKEYSIFD